MFERLHTKPEAYAFQLGAALKMEETVLEILDKNVEESRDERLKQLFRHHQDETHHHITNLQQVFASFGWEADDSPCPAIQALEKEGKANVKKSDDSVVDGVILGSAMEVEHHEIGVYEHLIIDAQAMGKEEAVRLLQQNLEDEQHTLDEVKDVARRVAAESAQPAAS